jgi:hypothetical protein
MDIQEAIEWADECVLAKTGKRLDSLQRTILEKTLENKTYQQVAEDYHCTEDHAKRVASELWKLLSDVLGENVKKSNVRAILEKVEFYNISNWGFGDDQVQIVGNVTFCKDVPYPQTKRTTKDQSTATNQPEKYHDLTEAPEAGQVCNRTTEQTTLKQWILEKQIRIVTIFGLPGIGKTTLAREVVEQIKDNFEYVVWRNCSDSLTLQSLQTNLLQVFSQNSETTPTSLVDYLRSHRCLIILDDLQELFASQQLAGTYLPQYQDYSRFWQQIARSPHQSCWFLLSWEKPTEIATLEGENRHCRSLPLRGLGESAAEILKNKGLTDEPKWENLIQRYSGNPSWLNIIASTIQDLFNGSVDRFLSYPTLFLGDLESILQTHYQRLSDAEKTVMLWLANQHAANIADKPTDLAVSDAEFLKAVQSLRKRGLIEKETNSGESLFAVQSLFKAYLQNN